MLPQWPHALALAGALNVALKMKLLPDSELAQLENKLFRVRVRDSGGEASYTFRNGLFRGHAVTGVIGPSRVTWTLDRGRALPGRT